MRTLVTSFTTALALSLSALTAAHAAESPKPGAARNVVLVDAGHLSLVSHPKEIADIILAAAGQNTN